MTPEVREMLPALVPVIMLALNYFQDKVLPDLKMPRYIKWGLSTFIGLLLGWLADNPTLGGTIGFMSSAAFTGESVIAKKKLDK